MIRTVLILSCLFCAAAAHAQSLSVREALAMIETGATQPQRSSADRIRGRDGEVSRFQILPSIWHRYSASREYDNPEIAWQVANQILDERIGWFRSRTNRAPTTAEVYLLWHRPGHFSAAGFDTARVRRLFVSRAERFANLCSDS
jgi:hypothetical protein